METGSTPAPGNSLGLDIQNLSIEDDGTIPAPEPSEQLAHPSKDGPTDATKKAEKKKPYVNADRHMTGSNPREKPSDNELAARMARIRENNERIKQRRLDVQADEDAFKKSEEEERAVQARIRKVQEGVDNARQQSARRKMEKIEAREWDTGKKDGQPENLWGHEEREKEGKTRGRGRGRGHGRGRGRGRGQSQGDAAIADSDPWAPTTSGAEAGDRGEDANQTQSDQSSRPTQD